MIVDVIKVQVVEAEEKPTMYKLTARGTGMNYEKMTVTIESEYKSDIERYIPLSVGERRGVEFRLLNRTLDEFVLDEERSTALEKRKAAAKAVEGGK